MAPRLRSFIASALAVFIFVTQVVLAHAVETAIWSERRQARDAALEKPVALARLPASSLTTLLPKPTTVSTPMEQAGISLPADDLLKHIPAAAGLVLKIIPPNKPARGTVFYLQDVHANAEAQKNLSHIVGALAGSEQVSLLALEGAFGPLDLSWYQKFPDREAMRPAADFLFRTGRITGPVRAAFDQPHLKLAGIDDSALYEANVIAARGGEKQRKRSRGAWARRQTDLEQAKDKTFSAELRALDRAISAYRLDSGLLRDLVRTLARHAEPAPGLRQFLTAAELEESLSLPAVESERQRLLTRLSEKLTQADMEALVEAATAYRTGRINHAAFYSSLHSLCESRGEPLSRYPAMGRYVRYVMMVDRIDGGKLLSETTALEKSALHSLARTDEERRLIAESRRHYLAGRLIDFALTPDEWREYKEVPSDWFLVPSNAGLGTRNQELGTFEDFYRAAEKRDAAIAANLIRTMEERKTDTALLVTGGFHSDGVSARLAAAGYRTAVLLPSLTKVDTGTGSSYLSFFSREKTPLENLFPGERLFLTAPPFPAAADAAGKTATAAGALRGNRVPEQTVMDQLRSGMNWASVQVQRGNDAIRFIGRRIGETKRTETLQARYNGQELVEAELVNVRDDIQMPLLEEVGVFIAAQLLSGQGLPGLLIARFVFTLLHLGQLPQNPSRKDISSHLIVPALVSVLSLYIAGESGWGAEDPRLLWLFFPVHIVLNIVAGLLNTALQQTGVAFRFRKAVLIPSKTDVEKELESLLFGGHHLIFADNADPVDEFLFQAAKRRNQTYLRLTLRDQEDLDRLMTAVTVAEGKMTSHEGPLVDVIRKGGVLLIDYANSHPKVVESFNSLFDERPYFGAQMSSGILRIIGVMRKADTLSQNGSFYSRLRPATRVRATDLDYRDPIKDLKAPPADADAEEIELYESPFFREMIIENYRMDDGIIRRIEAGLAKGKSVTLKGGNWGNPRFTHFIRQILMKREIQSNGKTVPLADHLQIYRVSGDYSTRPVEKKSVVRAGEGAGEGPLWIINRETQDMLRSRNSATRELALRQYPGLLNEPSLRVRITDTVDDWVWHMLLHIPGQDGVAERIIEVAPGVTVPRIYRKLRSKALSQTAPKTELQIWDQVKDQTGILVTGSDPDYIRSFIEHSYTERRPIVSITVDPEMTVSDLVDQIRIHTDGGMKFSSKKMPLLQSLEDPAAPVFILQGLESNPSLLRSLETTLHDEPYLMVNGERVDLSGLPGRLVLTCSTRPELRTDPRRLVRMEPSDAEMERLLAADLGERFDADEFRNRVLAMRGLIASLPAPRKGTRILSSTPFGYAQIRQLYRYDNWMDAFEFVFAGDHAENPEALAYIRTTVRQVFDIEEEGRNPSAIQGPLLRDVLSHMPPFVPVRDFSWQLADTLGRNLLPHGPLPFDKQSADRLLLIIGRALKTAHAGERGEYYARRFSIPENAEDGPLIDNSVPSPHSWATVEARVHRALARSRAVFLKGPPGVGKSHLAAQLAEGSPIQPITVGSDSKLSDVVGTTVFENGQTRFEPGPIAEWALSQTHHLLVIDEANLPTPSFWNIFEGFFDEKDPHIWINGEKVSLKNKRIIFTGNQDYLTDRHPMALLRQHVPTITFLPFNDAFLEGELNKYLAAHSYTDRAGLAKCLLALHRLFEKVGVDRGFSLRDLQELATRMNLRSGSTWTVPEAVITAWQLYDGLFSPEERETLRFLIHARFGVDPVEMEAALTPEQEEHRKGIEALFKAEEDPLVLTHSTLRLVTSFEQFLDVRNARMAGQAYLPGKRGMIYEGPSGRGKDRVPVVVLRGRGFVEHRELEKMNPADRDRKIAERKVFIHINASLNYSELEDKIREARSKGWVIIISELNILKSGLIEGKLNPLLTDSGTVAAAVPGFAFVATVNSPDFSGREKFSTALQNRIIYERLDDYDENELRQIATEYMAKYPWMQGEEEDIEYAVQAHLWIRKNIKNPAHRPTIREFKALLYHVAGTIGQRNQPTGRHLWHGATQEDNVRTIYGPVYLDLFLNGQKLPARAALAEPTSPPNGTIALLKRIGQALLPRHSRAFDIQPDASMMGVRGGGYMQLENNVLGYRPPVSDDILDTFWHEISHGLFTRRSDLTPGRMDELNSLYQDLEDLRHLAAMDRHNPGLALSGPEGADQRFAALLTSRSLAQLQSWRNSKKPLTPRQIFSTCLVAYAKGLEQGVDYRESIAWFAGQTEGAFVSNPFVAALRHLDTARAIREAIPMTFDQDEISFQQYRALKRMETMRQDYLQLEADPPEQLPTISQSDQRTMAKQSHEELDRTQLSPRRATYTDEQIGAEAEESAAVEVDNFDDIETAELVRQAQRQTAGLLLEKTYAILDEIKSALDSPEGVNLEFIDEARGQLTDPNFPRSLVPALDAIREHPLIADSIKRGVETRVRKVMEQLNKTSPASLNLTPQKKSSRLLKVTLGLVIAIVLGNIYFYLYRQPLTLSDPDSILPGPDTLPGLPGNDIIIPGNSVSEIPSLLPIYIGIVLVLAAVIIIVLRVRLSGRTSYRPGLFNVAPRGTRLRAGGAMAHGKTVTNPIPMEPEKRDLAFESHALRKQARLPWLSRISHASQHELDAALKDFVDVRLEADRVYGLQGTLSVERWMAGRLPHVFARTGGRETRNRQEILITHPVRWNTNILALELLDFLRESGFTVTVANQRMTPEEVEEIQKSREVHPVTMDELLAQVESVYAAAAVRDALGPSSSEESPGDRSSETTKLSLDEQVKEARAYFENQGIHVSIDSTENYFLLTVVALGPGSKKIDLAPLARYDRLINLSLTGFDIKSLEPISFLPNLRVLGLNECRHDYVTFGVPGAFPVLASLSMGDRIFSDLKDSISLLAHLETLQTLSIDRDQPGDFSQAWLLEPLILAHPRQEFKVWMGNLKQSREYSKSNLPGLGKAEDDDVKLAKLSFPEQIMDAAKFLENQGVKVTVHFNLELQKFTLTVDGQGKLIHLTNLIQYDRLGGLRINNASITSLSPITELTNLEYLDLNKCRLDYEAFLKPGAFPALEELAITASNFSDPRFLVRLPRLTNAEFHSFGIEDAPSPQLSRDSFRVLFERHPNRNNLRIVSGPRSLDSWDLVWSLANHPDLLPRQKSETHPAPSDVVEGELNFEAQEELAKEILKDMGQPVPYHFGMMRNVDQSRKLILDMKGPLTPSIIEKLRKLTLLDTLMIDTLGHGDIDVTVLSGMRRLSALDLLGDIRNPEKFPALPHLHIMSLKATKPSAFTEILFHLIYTSPFLNKVIINVEESPMGPLDLQVLQGVANLFLLERQKRTRDAEITLISSEIQGPVEHGLHRTLTLASMDNDALAARRSLMLKEIGVCRDFVESLLGASPIDWGETSYLYRFSLSLKGITTATTLSPLSKITLLDKLDISQTSIGDLAGIPRVRALDASDTPLRSLAPLFGKLNLTTLVLNNTQVPISEVRELFRRHPYRNLLTVTYNSVVIHERGHPAELNDRPAASDARLNNLARVIRALVTPLETLANVRSKMEEENLVQEFDNLMARLQDEYGINIPAAAVPSDPDETLIMKAPERRKSDEGPLNSRLLSRKKTAVVKSAARSWLGWESPRAASHRQNEKIDQMALALVEAAQSLAEREQNRANMNAVLPPIINARVGERVGDDVDAFLRPEAIQELIVAVKRHVKALRSDERVSPETAQRMVQYLSRWVGEPVALANRHLTLVPRPDEVDAIESLLNHPAVDTSNMTLIVDENEADDFVRLQNRGVPVLYVEGLIDQNGRINPSALELALTEMDPATRSTALLSFSWRQGFDWSRYQLMPGSPFHQIPYTSLETLLSELHYAMPEPQVVPFGQLLDLAKLLSQHA